MALNLDARQRAMLQDMGIKLWWPSAAPVIAHPTAHSAAASAAPALTAAKPAGAPRPAPIKTPAKTPVKAPAKPPTAEAQRAALIGAEATAPPAPQAARFTPPQSRHPSKSPSAARWLLVCDAPLPDGQSQALADQLLANILRALGLHEEGGVFCTHLQAPHPAHSPEGPGLDAPALLTQAQPDIVIALGLPAARALLMAGDGPPAPLAQLRAQTHDLQGCPLIVSYAPTTLLRSSASKALAWADWCQAQAIAQQARPTPGHGR